MKKYLVLALAGVLTLGLVACGKSSKGDIMDTLPIEEEGKTTDKEQTAEEVEEIPSEETATTALNILESTWSLFSEDEKFPATGGDFDGELREGPGEIDISNVDILDSVYGFPVNCIDKIDEGASLTHMMNLNTFTAACYHVSDNSGPGLAENVRILADDIKVNIMGRQWVCGFPDVVVIYTVGHDYIVTAFGKEDPISSFGDHLEEVFPNTTLLCKEDLQF